MWKHAADIITIGNLILGCVAITLLFEGQYILCFWLIFIAAFADLLDGMVARWVKVDGLLGLHLDSLADMVSFGVVPGMVMFHLLTIGWDGHPQSHLLALPGFLITAFACARLAIYNAHYSSQSDFTGLPTPSATGFVMGWLLIYALHPSLEFLTNPYWLYTIILIISWLMIAPLPMVSLKFKDSSWNSNWERYFLIGSGFLLLLIFKEWSFSMIILFYIMFSFVKYAFMDKTNN